ncbi:hypothetical protein DYB28_005451 [Aphanomyces astaci]|uniref:Peroxin-7 n=1 Tax=Aphanomyces astaci TaxID=112090 RepID=A0A9X8HDH8_APHAT|nr:hypothetical protein DYB28_005451 [Aphanomyces astaci]
MFGTVLTHEVKRIARSVDAVYGDSDQQRYVLGSCTPSSKKLNQLQLLDANLSVLQTYAHANPVQHLAMCPLPKKAHHVLTTFVSVPSIHLPRRCIAIGFARTRDDRFGHPSLNATSISTWTLADGGSGKEVAKLGLGEGHNQLNAIVWDPHHRQQVSATVDESIVTWDVRSGKVWCVKYNRFHDQLVLSSSSDSSVNLWRVSSISSAPLLDESTDAGGIDIGDAKISTHDGDHEDSVYAVAWGSQDSWVYVSLSYDGRVVLNTVPSTEKYRILL